MHPGLRLFASEIRHAIRTLRRNPSFVLTTTTTIALGAGTAIVVAHLIFSVFIRPLPYEDEQRVVMVWSAPPTTSATQMVVSWPDYFDLGRRTQTLEAIAAFNIASGDLSVAGTAESARGALITPEFFRVLGVRPALGTLLEEDGAINHERLVVSHRFWRTRLGGDPGVLGQNVRLSGRLFTIAGVLPPSFRHPEPFGSLDPDFWRLFDPADLQRPRALRYLRVVGRVRSGLALDSAQAELATIGGSLAAQYPDTNRERSFFAIPIRQQLLGDLRLPLLLLLVGSACLLLVVGLNLTNLQLARVSTRSSEAALRVALGATSGRIALWLLSESVVLVLVGGIGALLVASGAWRLFTTYAPQQLLSTLAPPPLAGWPAIVSSAAIAGGMLIFTMTPPLARFLLMKMPARTSTVSSTRGRGSQPVRDGLVIVQLALALPLVVSSLLLGQSLRTLTKVNLGFDVNDVLTFRLTLPEVRYAQPAQWVTFVDELTRELEHLPAVSSAGVTVGLPMTPLLTQMRRDVRVESTGTDRLFITAYYRVAGAGFFETMKVPLREGRFFHDTDVSTSRRVAIVNETFARRYWQPGEAIGKDVLISGDGRSWSIAGVIGDIRYDGPSVAAAPEIYVPYSQAPMNRLAIVMRVDGDPNVLTSPVRTLLQQHDRDLAPSDVSSMNDIVSAATSRPRLAVTAVTFAAGVAGLVALIGMSGVIGYFVSQRTREFCIRQTLGASPRSILLLVLRRSLVSALIGTALGLWATLVFADLLSGLLFGINPRHLPSIIGASAALVVAGLLAAYVPARRVLRLQPAELLKEEWL